MHTPAAPPAAARLDRAYPGRLDQIRAVRADLRALLHGWPMADDLILCASEMAANAALPRLPLPHRLGTARPQARRDQHCSSAGILRRFSGEYGRLHE